MLRSWAISCFIGITTTLATPHTPYVVWDKTAPLLRERRTQEMLHYGDVVYAQRSDNDAEWLTVLYKQTPYRARAKHFRSELAATLEYHDQHVRIAARLLENDAELAALNEQLNDHLTLALQVELAPALSFYIPSINVAYYTISGVRRLSGQFGKGPVKLAWPGPDGRPQSGVFNLGPNQGLEFTAIEHNGQFIGYGTPHIIPSPSNEIRHVRSKPAVLTEHHSRSKMSRNASQRVRRMLDNSIETLRTELTEIHDRRATLLFQQMTNEFQNIVIAQQFADIAHAPRTGQLMLYIANSGTVPLENPTRRTSLPSGTIVAGDVQPGNKLRIEYEGNGYTVDARRIAPLYAIARKRDKRLASATINTQRQQSIIAQLNHRKEQIETLTTTINLDGKHALGPLVAHFSAAACPVCRGTHSVCPHGVLEVANPRQARKVFSQWENEVKTIDAAIKRHTTALKRAQKRVEKLTQERKKHIDTIISFFATDTPSNGPQNAAEN